MHEVILIGTMLKTKNVGMFILTVAVLGGAAFVMNPGNSVFAQGNATINNATTTIDTDIWVESLKAKHPALAAIPDIADIAEDKEVIIKLKALDPKEALKTLALNIVRDLLQYKLAQQVQ